MKVLAYSIIKLFKFISFRITRFFGYNLKIDGLEFHSEIENTYFKKILSNSKSYLEYGSGASTILSASLKINTISIESDKEFVNSLLKLINDKSDLNLICRPLGMIGPWGSPVVNIFFPLTKSRKNKFSKYSDVPFLEEKFKDHTYPDLILIDGKFRVACALKCYLFFSQKNYYNYKIIFDDYLYRNQYHITEKILKLDEIVGEMGVFSPPKISNTDSLEKYINQYEFITD